MEGGSNGQNKGQKLAGPSKMHPSSICGLATATDASTPPAEYHHQGCGVACLLPAAQKCDSCSESENEYNLDLDKYFE